MIIKPAPASTYARLFRDGVVIVAVPLTNGGATLIDVADLEQVAKFVWWRGGTGYASRQYRKDGQCQRVTLHRSLLEVPLGLEIDHINRDKLDNRRCNLRICTHAENMQNRDDCQSPTGHRGVSFDKRRGKFRTHLMVDYKQIHLGYYETLDEAVRAVTEGRRIHMPFSHQSGDPV